MHQSIIVKPKDFGEWLLQERRRSGMSQAALANRVRQSQSLISMIERGTKLPEPELEHAIRKALGAGSNRFAAIAPTPEPASPHGGKLEDALTLLAEVREIIDEMGESSDLDAADERCIEAGMWIERHCRGSK